MKIAIITSTFPPYAGGIGNVAAYNAKELVKLGHDIKVFTPLYEPVEEEFENLKVERIKPIIAYGNSALTPGLGQKLPGFDIVHLHYPFFGGAEMVFWHAKKIKKAGGKIILHYHMDVVGSGLTKLIFKIHTKLVLPKIIKKADKVIVTSFDYANDSNISKLIKKNPDKFVEVPNGVDSYNFTPQAKSTDLLNRHQIQPSQKVVLFVGGLDKAHYFKGVEHLIEAMSRLKQASYSWRLVIVGKGELQKQYKDLAGQLNIDSKTIFTGFVPNVELPKYYNLADVVVLPSVDKSEAFGMTLIEGMACAKPVIASNLSGVRSVVDDSVNGLLIEPENPDDLASKINYILANNTVALNFGNNGRTKVEQNYEWKILAKQLENLYQNINE